MTGPDGVLMTAAATPATAAQDPVKPDLRTWLLVIGYGCAATSLLGTDLGFALLTGWVLALYAVLGEARRVPLLAGFYLLLFALRFLILAAGDQQVDRVAARHQDDGDPGVPDRGLERLRVPSTFLIVGYLVPVIMRSGRIADELARVAVCKGFEPGHPRSHLVQPRIQALDLALLAATALVCAALVLGERFGVVT